jgi:hypothetical protein
MQLEGSAANLVAEALHGRVDDVCRLLLDVRQQRRLTNRYRLRKIGQRRLGLIDVVEAEQRADRDAVAPPIRIPSGPPRMPMIRPARPPVAVPT